jgi:hypothetical protein
MKIGEAGKAGELHSCVDHFYPLSLRQNSIMEQRRGRRSSAMVEHMQRYPESDLTQTAYCETHRISKATSGCWLKKHRMQQREGSYGFVQIRPKQMEGKTEIHYTNGIVIRFSGPVDARYLKELVG